MRRMFSFHSALPSQDVNYMRVDYIHFEHLFLLHNNVLHNWEPKMSGFSVKVSIEEAIPSHSYSMDLLPILRSIFEHLKQNNIKSLKDLQNMKIKQSLLYSSLIFAISVLRDCFFCLSLQLMIWQVTHHQTFSYIHPLRKDKTNQCQVSFRQYLNWSNTDFRGILETCYSNA